MSPEVSTRTEPPIQEGRQMVALVTQSHKIRAMRTTDRGRAISTAHDGTPHDLTLLDHRKRKGDHRDQISKHHFIERYMTEPHIILSMGPIRKTKLKNRCHRQGDRGTPKCLQRPSPQ